MNVETFELSEVAEQTGPECSEEAVRLINELGLEGQKEFISEDTGKRFAYRKITKVERFVYGVLCPEERKVDEYSRTPYPLRILQVIAHAKTLFDHLFVWDVEDGSIKDPVLIGRQGSEWGSEDFILARWGEELEEFPALRKKAIDIKREQLRSSAKAVEAKSRTLSPDTLSDEEIVASGKGSMYSIYTP